jgi:hypothetical protein
MTARKVRSRRRRVTRRAPIWRSWRHFAAYMYLFICFFDFVAMPVFYEWARAPLSDLALLAQIKLLDISTQIEVMKILTTEQRWEPLTLGENGLFHLAFGAILGVAAWTRGTEKVENAARGVNDDHIEVEEVEEDQHAPAPAPLRGVDNDEEPR